MTDTPPQQPHDDRERLLANAVNTLRDELSHRGVDVNRLNDTDLQSMVEHLVSFYRVARGKH
jgi:predicted HTH domain antitoxin